MTPQHPVVASASRPPPGRRPGAASASTLRTLVAPQRIAAPSSASSPSLPSPPLYTYRRLLVPTHRITSAPSSFGSTLHLHWARRAKRRVLQQGLRGRAFVGAILGVPPVSRPYEPPKTPAVDNTIDGRHHHATSIQRSMTLVFFAFLFFRYRPSPRRGGTERYGHADAATRDLEVNDRRVTI